VQSHLIALLAVDTNEMAKITDTERLDWLIRNGALVRTGGERSPDPYYFIVYRNGETGGSYPTPLQAIDAEIRDS